MYIRLFKRGDIVETADGKLGVVSIAGAQSISADLIVRKAGLDVVSGNPTEFKYIPASKTEKEYLVKKGRLNLNDYK